MITTFCFLWENAPFAVFPRPFPFSPSPLRGFTPKEKKGKKKAQVLNAVPGVGKTFFHLMGGSPPGGKPFIEKKPCVPVRWAHRITFAALLTLFFGVKFTHINSHEVA